MKKLSLSHTLIIAAAMAAGGIAHAQTRAAETTNTPQRAGEASTVTGGAPNVATTNAVTTTRPTGVNTAKPAETANVPPRAGEASTMTGGAPNAQTSNAVTTDKKTTSMDRKAAKVGTTGTAVKAGGETSNTPQRQGEASTMTGGAPNAKTTN